MTIKKLILFLILGVLSSIGRGQILFSESFNVILDSTKIIKGSITPDFKFQTQQENLTEFENLADITVRWARNALTLANKIEFSKYGDETYMSGGYLYAEYRNLLNRRIIPETFAQIHWSEARGLQWKYAFGIYGRFRLIYKNDLGVFAGVGPFYEFERWGYEGVDAGLLPANQSPIENKSLKMGSYISYKQQITNRIGFDVSVYHQAKFNQIISAPRLASSTGIGFNLTEHLELKSIYQNLYDFNPVVPINKWFHRVIISISFSF